MELKYWRNIAICAVALTTACARPSPPENLEPFVSERLIGDWSGVWALPAMFQTGTAEMQVSLEDEDTIRFLFTIDGGIVSPDDEEPVIVDLSGTDGHKSVTLSGEGDKIGYVEFTIDENGLITGNADPDGLSLVDFGGWVGAGKFHLDFVVLGLFPGEGELGLLTDDDTASSSFDTGDSLEAIAIPPERELSQL